MWTFRVVVPSPLLNDDPGFIEAVEDLSVEQFISEPAVEALTVSVLSRAAWFDISRLRSNSCNPLSYGLSDELRAVVRPYECWRATHYK